MEFKQHSLYQLGSAMILSLIMLLVFAFSQPIFMLLPIGYAILAYFRWKNYRIILEDNKLVLEYGVFSKHREQIIITKIQKIRLSRSFVQSVFSNLGSISLETGNDLTITLDNIEFYQKLFDELEKRTNNN